MVVVVLLVVVVDCCRRVAVVLLLFVLSLGVLPFRCSRCVTLAGCRVVEHLRAFGVAC